MYKLVLRGGFAMSATENNSRRFGKRFTQSAVGAALGMALSMLLMLAASALLADGKLRPEYANKIVMLCVFSGCFLASLLTISKQGRGELGSVLLHCVMCLVLLSVFAIAAGSQRIFNAAMFKSAICAVTGCVLAGTVHMYRKTRGTKRRRRK